MRVSSLMGPNGGDSGNEIGFVLLSCPPGPVRLFLLVLLHGALSAVTSPSNLFILTSSPLCSVERKKDVFSQHVPLRVNVFFLGHRRKNTSRRGCHAEGQIEKTDISQRTSFKTGSQ